MRVLQSGRGCIARLREKASIQAPTGTSHRHSPVEQIRVSGRRRRGGEQDGAASAGSPLWRRSLLQSLDPVLNAAPSPPAVWACAAVRVETAARSEPERWLFKRGGGGGGGGDVLPRREAQTHPRRPSLAVVLICKHVTCSSPKLPTSSVSPPLLPIPTCGS